jgi:hypothetical protein
MLVFERVFVVMVGVWGAIKWLMMPPLFIGVVVLHDALVDALEDEARRAD